MLSALNAASRPEVLAQTLPAGLLVPPSSSAAQDNEATILAPAISRGSVSTVSALSNYGLPRNVVIARLTNPATAGATDRPAPTPSETGENTGDTTQEPAWGLSIASRYVGAYASPGRAASAAYDLVA